MKRFLLCYAWIIVSFFWCVHASANLTFHDNTHSVKIISNPIYTFESKPSSIKLASVQFLSDANKISFDSGKLDVKTQCASLGYTINVSNCKGSMKPSYLCDRELPSVSGANQYTTGCCNSDLYTAAKPEDCQNNSTSVNDTCYYEGASGKKKYYRCSCDRTVYPYGEDDNPCSNGIYNYNNSCTARVMNQSGTAISKTFYSSCCPSDYQVCEGKYVGEGGFCTVKTGSGSNDYETRYQRCICSSSYDTICSDLMIDPSDYCEDYRNRKFTRSNNCENSCDQTRETNIDKYLYGRVWHCLYEKDGASIKNTEGNLCYNPNGVTTEEDKDYLDQCAAQGYVKSKNDCFIDSLILYCPNDDSKVWCLDGKYCTGFNVAGDAACNVGANVDYCDSKDKGTRCAYKVSECNKCWSEEGKYIGGCENLDASMNGDSEKCCKLGYRMENGICVKNTCDRTQFPYQLRPDATIGEVETCYEGDESANLGYRAYFGYASCRSDESKGEMWMQDPSNSRKCICNRTSDTLGHLPYGIEDYFNPNVGSNPGFNAGYYGEYRSCSDPEGSYYGYTMCYVGRYMSSKGKCSPYWLISWGQEYPYTSEGGINCALDDRNLPNISAVTEPRTSEQAYCVHKYTHCEARDGTKLGDADVCALVPEGCNLGYEAACNVCYHKESVSKGNDGLYHLADYQIIVNSCDNNRKYLGFAICPRGLKKGGNSVNICYNYCYTSDYSKCRAGDVLWDGNTKLGIIFYKNGNTLRLYAGYTYNTWDGAKTYLANYAPVGYENHPYFGKGKWKMPTPYTHFDNSNCSFATARGTGFAENIGIVNYTWVDQEADEKRAYYDPYNDGLHVTSKSSSLAVNIQVEFTYE